MAYMLLIMEPVDQRAARTRAAGEALYQRMLDFSADLKARGLLTIAQSLTADATGVRISGCDGNAAVLDGPFAESKEMVGGFFLLTCATRAEAVAIARRCPAAEWATVEVRELGRCFA
jgi:hypothetical protein